MSSATALLNKYIVPPLTALSENTYLSAIRAGMVAIVPLTIIGGLLTGSYLLMSWGVIHKPFVNVPWTTPPIIGHYLVSGGDWKAAVWGAVSILIAMAIYFPFAKAAERQRLSAEAAGKARE